MADVELQTILTGGSITNMYIGGATSTERVLTSSETDTKIGLALENSHTLLLDASSTAASQQPSAVDTALQVEFGALQTTTDVSLSAAGAITFNTAGKYIISISFQYGRTGGASTAILFNRLLVNGTQIGSSSGAKIDDADTLVPWSGSIQFTASAADVLTIEIIRDSTGNDSGGLFLVNPTAAGWADAPSAAIKIFKAV